jgi:hypothetical protein
MKKFLVLYRAPISASEQMAKTTPEQAKQGMDRWKAWGAKAAASIVDMGAPLERAAAIAGPASAGHIGGFSIMQAASVEALKKTLDGHPHLKMPSGSIEVFEFLSLPGM